MSAVDHPDYTKETEKLACIIKYLQNYHQRIIEQKSRIDKEVDYGVRHYNSDNAEQFNELIINTTLQENLNQKLKNLDKSIIKPYFARVDFEESGSSCLENLYIGKMSVLRDEDQKLLIVDWRAPIATLYYEGRLGESRYESPEGAVDGHIHLKRQYVIENAQLKDIYDIDITTNDDFLQACLGSSKDKRLKDIVSTIQAEQNRVIRSDMWKPLIVQGAAGGGKTTIALHRIAYLLYNNEKTLSPKNFMIIAPNRFFLSYISEVLPDLGVENVIQTTFEDLAQDLIGIRLKLKPSHEKLAGFINNNSEPSVKAIELAKKISAFKSSLEYKSILNHYIRKLEMDLVPEDDFKIDAFTLLPSSQIKRLFLEEYSYLPVQKRVNELKKNLINTLKQQKSPIIEEIQYKYDREIDKLRLKMKDCSERREKIIELAAKRDMLIEKIKKGSKTLVRDYLDKFKISTPYEYYKDFIQNKEIFLQLANKYIDVDCAEHVRCCTKTTLDKGLVDIDDLSPLIHIKLSFFGLDEKFPVRHIVIDEAQDFSLFQFFILKKLINSGSFTILGDLCQGIHSYRGIKAWKDVENLIFKDDNSCFLTLEQSYRTTVEIMEAANSVISALGSSLLPVSKPVIRHGEKVKVIEKENLKEIAEEIAFKVNSLQSEGYKSAAIICKTMDECLSLKAELGKLKIKLSIITGSEKDYSGGIVIVPSYLVKGLEFDVVLIANASKSNYTTDELDIKLLYIAMTRPLHKLCIYSAGEKSELLRHL